MTHTTHRSIARICVSAGLLLVASAALAATGFTVTQAQESQVSAGMSRDEVRAALGRPSHNLKYMNEPGRTWTYGVMGNAVAENTVFDVDFSANGKVMHSSERVEQMPK